MEKGYYLKRIIRSIFSILLVITIVFILVYSLVPRDRIFNSDDTLVKLGGKPDERLQYQMRTWQRLGYIDYENMSSYCSSLYEAGSDEIVACNVAGSKEEKDFVKTYEALNYDIQYLPISHSPIASKDRPIALRIAEWFKQLIHIDGPNYVDEEMFPDLERKIYFGKTPTGGLAIKCAGCEHKYLAYTDSVFPFIHQNWISLYLGQSYPTFDSLQVLNVISDSQGQENRKETVFEDGHTEMSAYKMTACKWKNSLDKLDKNKFQDNYADCTVQKKDPSMMGISFIMGVIALILAYGLGLPIGLLMSQSKGGIIDKLGMFYIIFIISVPSLAYIYFFKFLGSTFFHLPTAFPTYGVSDIRSWVLPCISLALPSIASLMLWTRRYMVDQMNSDYVKFAKAKGLNQSEIYRKHIFRNAIIPIAQGIPSSLAGCITGAIITESVYAVGGMGKMLPDSINSYNNAMIIALAFLYTTISIIGVFLGDVIITWIDPRISLANKEEGR